jgi:FkbM family methyltransferase
MNEHLGKLARKWLEGLGLKLYRRRKLPVGIDLCLDLRRSMPNGRIATVFDVGANIGQTATRFARYFPEARIFSFEPVEDTFRQLTLNTNKFANVRCFRTALGSEDGSRRLYHQKDSRWNSLAEGVNSATETGIHEDISISTVDAFCSHERIQGIDLLKTDTEGYDLEVLNGATGKLKEGKIGFIYTETTFSDLDSQHTNFYKIVDFLKAYDFHFIALYDQCVGRKLIHGGYCNALFANPEAV